MSYMSIRRLIPLAVVFALITYPLQAEELKPKLRVGIIAPLSGELAVFGAKIMEGVELAKERLANLPVEFYVEDAGDVSRSTVVAAAQKLVSVNHIDIMVALVFEDHLSKIFPLLKRNNIPVIGAGLCSDITLSFSNAACSYPSARAQLIPMFPDAKKRNIKTFGFIGEESAFSQGALREFSRLTSEKEFVLTNSAMIAPNSLDFRSTITKLLASKPDAMVVCTTDPAKSLAILRQLKEQGFTGTRYGFIDYDKKYYADFGEAVKGVILPGWVSSHFGEDFIRRYTAKWPKKVNEIDVYSTLSYDMLSFSTQSALELRKQNLPLTIQDIIKYHYVEPAIPDFHYKSDRTVSMPMVVKAIAEGGDLTEVLP